MTVKISQLANGLTVATDMMQEAQSVALGIWVGVGTRDEPAEAQGVAHLVEHMLFKGTPTRDAKAISEAIEGVGGYINAYTSREETAYYVRVLPEHVDLALDVLADMVQRSLLDETELTRERDVIIQEIGQAYDTPEDFIFDCAQEVAFPGQGIGWPILGQAANIATMPRARLQDYIGRLYSAQNMIVVGAGAVEHDQLLRLAERCFADLSAGQSVTRAAARYEGGQRHEERELEQNHLLIGFNAPGFNAPDYEAMQLLANLLGGGSASRLFQEVREKRGLAYHVSASAQAYADAGSLWLYAGTSPEKAQDLQDVMWEELARLPRDLNMVEYRRAQAQLRAGLIMAQETPGHRADQLASSLLTWRRVIPIEEKLSRLAAVTPEHIVQVAEKLTPAHATVVTLGQGVY